MCSEHVYLKFKQSKDGQTSQALLTKTPFIATWVIETLKLVKTVMQPDAFHWANTKTWFGKASSTYSVSLIFCRKINTVEKSSTSFEKKKSILIPGNSYGGKKKKGRIWFKIIFHVTHKIKKLISERNWQMFKMCFL